MATRKSQIVPFSFTRTTRQPTMKRRRGKGTRVGKEEMVLHTPHPSLGGGGRNDDTITEKPKIDKFAFQTTTITADLRNFMRANKHPTPVKQWGKKAHTDGVRNNGAFNFI
jgi:hypothetical protein